MKEKCDGRLVKYTEAARFLDVKPRTLRGWTRTHSIPYVKIGHTVRYRICDLLDWADKHLVVSDGSN